MRITFDSFRDKHVSAVQAFNERAERLSPHKEFRLAPRPAHGRFAPDSGNPVWEDYYLALEGEQVRGGYALRRLPFQANAVELKLGFFYAPVAEALWDKRYAMVASQLLRDALRRNPHLFCLGMGGWGNPLPKMLRALKWGFREVPFRFRVCRASRFLREIKPLRTSRPREAVADIAAWTGVGAVGVSAWQRLRGAPGSRGLEVLEEREFGDWADEVWTRGRDGYALAQLRTRQVLELLYPASDSRFLRLRARRHGAEVGWAVMFDTTMRDDQYFGNLRVGTIIDGFAHPDDVPALLAAAAEHLQDRGVDLIISNQAHEAWVGGLERAGFLTGPSNFLFAAAPGLAKILEPFEQSLDRAHLNRGDGDGPIHL